MPKAIALNFMGYYNYYMVAFNCILYTGFFIVFSYSYILEVENVEPKAWRLRRVCDQKGEPSKKDATVTVGGDGNGAGTQLAKDSRMEDRVGPIPTVQREAIVSSNFGTGHNSPSGQGNRFQGEMSSRVTSEMISDISISSNNLTQEHYQIDELELTVTDKN